MSESEPILRVADATLLQLYNVRDAGAALVKFLRTNTGDSADWPIRIVADDDMAPKLAQLLSELEAALTPAPAPAKQ